MAKHIPSANEIRELLSEYGRDRILRLSTASGVPFHTLLKIKSGETDDPRLSTVRAFWPHLAKQR